ncbi:MAG: hypothetical protein HYU71_15735 [Bacteroidetes bacterium]|nr:hypothetical protein [Bacteroidota bacterium]
MRFVPFAKSYKVIERWNGYADLLLYVSTIFSLVITFLGGEMAEALKTALITINCIIIAAYVGVDNWCSLSFAKTEMRRRVDWLDNSFNTNYSGQKSKGYFTNENVSPGLYKLAVNGFENSHHTHFIISKMLTGIFFKTVVIAAVFIFSFFYGNRELFRLLFELPLPVILIQKFIKACYYQSRMDNVQDRFKTLFNDLIHGDFDKYTASVLRGVIDYEATLSWASIPLKGKLFEKYKDQLSEEWEQLKINYGIKPV